MGEQPVADHGASDTNGSDTSEAHREDSETGGRERVPDGGEPAPGDGDRPSDSESDGYGSSADRRRYPGVQSLQLTRGDIPRHRGDRPNEVTEEDLDELAQRIEEFEAEIEDRTVHREELERELKGYVRERTRRGRARGWGPYLVLLYGTAMTLGAFFFLGSLLAVLAMIVIWLSTLGLYALMVLIGATSSALGLPGRIARRLGELRNIR